MNQPVPPAPTPLNMRVSPENRAKFTGFLEGVRSKAVTSQMPPPMPMQPGMMPQGQAMGMPPMPPQGMMPPMQPPMQPPMMPPRPMNMGGMVDVFDPMYMNEGGFVISTDDSGKIRTRPVFDENKGRMVSQILSRDMVDEMAKAAMAKANQPEPVAVEPDSTLVAINKILEDDYESGKGFAETMQPVTTKPTIKAEPTKKSTISLPVSKPKAEDFLYDVTNADEMSVFSDISLPVSKPRRDEPVFRTMLKDFYSDRHGGSGAIDDISTDALKSLMPTNKELISDQVASVISDEAEDVSDPQTIADLILGRGDAVFDTPTLGNLSRDVMARRLIEDDPPPISDSMPDRAIGLLDRLYNPGLQADEEEEGLGLLAKILNAIRPRYNRMGFGEELGVDRRPFLNQDSTQFNDGGIVQGFRAGGVAKDRYEDFSSNISGNVGGRVDIRDSDDLGTEERVIRDIDDLGTEERVIKDIDDLGSATPIFKTSQPIVDANLAFGGSDVFSTPYADEGFAKAEANPLNKYVAPVTNFIAGLQTNPNTGQKFDMSNTSDRYDYYNLTQQTKEASERAAEARRRDQDREAAKLAEEQRLRDMIQGMLPPTAATAPTTPAPDAPVADPATPDYGSVVVPSDRVPGFDVGNISPYPQFRMPTEFSPVFPTSLSANYFKDLFKNIGVKNMQQGGSVNQLDSAIDNFINAYR